jgi:hypothetical protein
MVSDFKRRIKKNKSTFWAIPGQPCASKSPHLLKHSLNPSGQELAQCGSDGVVLSEPLPAILARRWDTRKTVNPRNNRWVPAMETLFRQNDAAHADSPVNEGFPMDRFRLVSSITAKRSPNSRIPNNALGTRARLRLARAPGRDGRRIDPALLHDIGHLLDTEETIRCERVGVVSDDVGRQLPLDRGFSERLATLVGVLFPLNPCASERDARADRLSRVRGQSRQPVREGRRQRGAGKSSVVSRNVCTQRRVPARVPAFGWSHDSARDVQSLDAGVVYAVGLTVADAAQKTVLFPLFGGLSVLVAGVLSDRLGKSGRAIIIFLDCC